jgi:hypothetical protein
MKAARPKPGCERGGKSERDCLRRCLSPSRPVFRQHTGNRYDAHRLCRLIWKILHEGIRYEERGPAVSHTFKQVRAAKMIRQLQNLGNRVELMPSAPMV